MAELLIAEFRSNQIGDPGPIAKVPPSVEQVLTYTTSTPSAVFDAATAFVRIKALDAPAYLEFGVAPTATTANAIHLALGAVEHFAVTAGQKVAAYDGTS